MKQHSLQSTSPYSLDGTDIQKDTTKMKAKYSKNRGTVQVSMRMPTWVKLQVDKLALQTGWTNSYVMTELIRGSLDVLSRDMLPPSLGRILKEIEEREDQLGKQN